jgi:hypothetical protein
MDPGTAYHVLAQEVDTDVHEFGRIERASPLFRRRSCVCRPSLEREVKLIDCKGFAHPDAVCVARVPGQDRVNVVEYTGPCHKGFPVSAFLGRTTKQPYCPWQRALFKNLLDTDSSCNSSRP